jgi:hypothetical protein
MPQKKTGPNGAFSLKREYSGAYKYIPLNIKSYFYAKVQKNRKARGLEFYAGAG